VSVHIRLLGEFAVEIDGHPVDTAGLARRGRELVKLIALAPARRLARDNVIETLFGHLDAEAGGANLTRRRAWRPPVPARRRRAVVAASATRWCELGL